MAGTPTPDVHVDWHMTPQEWGALSFVLSQHADTPYIARLIEAGKIPAPPAAPAGPKPAPELAEMFRGLALELDAEADNLGGGVGYLTRHEIAGRIRRRLAQQPQPAPELAASSPDRPTVKFAAWMASQGYPAPDDRYDGDEMAAAFEAGITAAVVAYATRHDAQPALELAAVMGETRGYRERLAAIRKLCEARIKVVGMVDGKGVARKVIAIIDKPEAGQ